MEKVKANNSVVNCVYFAVTDTWNICLFQVNFEKKEKKKEKRTCRFYFSVSTFFFFFYIFNTLYIIDLPANQLMLIVEISRKHFIFFVSFNFLSLLIIIILFFFVNNTLLLLYRNTILKLLYVHHPDHLDFFSFAFCLQRNYCQLFDGIFFWLWGSGIMIKINQQTKIFFDAIIARFLFVCLPEQLKSDVFSSSDCFFSRASTD